MERCAALVTGASSGIGLEFARLLAKAGNDLVLVARNQPVLEQVADSLRRRYAVSVTVVAVDLANPSGVEVIAEELRTNNIKIDTLVNNAGFNVYGRFDRTDASAELDMVQVNVVALTRLTKMLLPRMIETGYGRILNVGSTGSFAPGPFDAVYCATKAYVLSFSEAIAEELDGTGVSVTALCPGATKTAFAARAGMHDTAMFRGQLSDPAYVAAVGYRAMTKGRRIVMPGLMNVVMTQSIRMSPRAMVAAVSRRMLAPVGA